MFSPIEPRRPTVLDPTRAKPEPWFVGGGKGLMIGVLGVCAVLIAARLASMVWLAEEGWAWWRENRPELTRRVRGLPADAPIVPLPRGIVPPPDPAKANRGLIGNPATAFGADTYPILSIIEEEQGRAVVRLAVDASGTPVVCNLLESSGFKRLDERTCELGLKRVRFQPARDAAGRARATQYKLPVRWVLPQT